MLSEIGNHVFHSGGVSRSRNPGPELSPRLGQSVVIENRAGANGA